jgi:hypothetical protein
LVIGLLPAEVERFSEPKPDLLRKKMLAAERVTGKS